MAEHCIQQVSCSLILEVKTIDKNGLALYSDCNLILLPDSQYSNVD
jgi:hypothetical protein